MLDASICINNGGALLSYILIVGSLLQEVTSGSSSNFADSIEFLTIIPVFLISLPFCLIRNFGHLVSANK